MFLFPIYIRFCVAIKSAMEDNESVVHMEDKAKLKVSESSLLGLLDEAKCMVKIGGYHTNIVNLQGIILEEDVLNTSLTKVWYHRDYIDFL